MSHNYSDIGTIKVDTYINTRRAQVDVIQTINSDELGALMQFQASSGNEQHSRRQVYNHDTLPTIFTKFGVQFSFCSTAARIRSFNVNNKPVGYTRTNASVLVHGFKGGSILVHVGDERCNVFSNGLHTLVT